MYAYIDKLKGVRPTIAITGYVIFLIIYYAPIGLQDSGFNLDARALTLLERALSVNSVLIDLALNLAGHFLLTSLFYLLVNYVISTIGLAFRINKIMLTLIIVPWSWLLLSYINTLLFPNSLYVPPFSTISTYAIIAGSILISLTFIAQIAQHPKNGRPILVILLAVVVGSLLISIKLPGNTSRPQQRNVILIGVDSLSPKALAISKHLLPNIAGLTESSIWYSQAYTPIGRTFPAWISILSGKPPADHGAYFNLRDINQVERQNLLTNDMKAQGYRTIFAIDERRFCNIDESFGFDHVIGPKAGMLDFLLQRFNDTPLTNLALQFKGFSPFFVYSYMNTASYTNYNPDAILNEIGQELKTKQPLFLAVHFESAHFPYKTTKTYTKLKSANDFLSKQSSALQQIDYQIGVLLHKLQYAGILENAMIIFLSDHGEGLGEPEVIQYKETTNLHPHDHANGHGANIVSSWQNHVVLNIVEFKNGRIKSTPTIITENVSLLNIRKIVFDYAFNDVLEEHAQNNACFPVETGIRFSEADDYKNMDQKKLVAEGLQYYSVDKTGRMILREDKLKSLVEKKDIGVWCGDKLTFFSATANKIYTLKRKNDLLFEIEIDPEGLQELKKYIRQYRKSSASLPH